MHSSNKALRMTRDKSDLAALEIILAIGIGFVVRPFVDAVASRDYGRAALAIVYVAVALRRILPRISPAKRTRA